MTVLSDGIKIPLQNLRNKRFELEKEMNTLWKMNNDFLKRNTFLIILKGRKASLIGGTLWTMATNPLREVDLKLQIIIDQ